MCKLTYIGVNLLLSFFYSANRFFPIIKYYWVYKLFLKLVVVKIVLLRGTPTGKEIVIPSQENKILFYLS